VVAFLIGCTILLIVAGCSGTRSESPKQQGDTEATREQTRSAKAASEEARCAETQLIDHHRPSVIPDPGRSDEDWETNNVPGCPKGGPLLGTDSSDKLDGLDGDDEIRGLGAKDDLIGGQGSDTIYGGPGKDWLRGAPWEGGDPVMSKDVLYGGPGNDDLDNGAGYDVLYGGDGHDILHAGKGENVLYGGDANDILYAGRERMSSIARMATMFSLLTEVGSGTSSIAAKARTATLLTIKTMWIAVARSTWAADRLDPLGHR
jgi:hypothetical protein